jgi:hypothetical protein
MVRLPSISFLLIICIGGAIRISAAQDWQQKTCPASEYSVGFDGCLHRSPGAVLAGCKPRRDNCPGKAGPATPVSYVTATPSQVNTALICDIAQAAKATKGKNPDLSKAVITGDLSFNLVTKSSSGASLAIAAIPVFTGASVAPSLAASSITTQTVQTDNSFVVAPSELSTCDHYSPNNWLLSNVVTSPLKGQQITQVTEAVSFIVTRQGSVGLKLNIIPVSIGPQFSDENDKTQKICLLFDFTNPNKPSKASCPGGGGGNNNNGKNNN